MKQTAKLFAIALFSGAITLAGYKIGFEKKPETNSQNKIQTSANLLSKVNLGAENIDFTSAAENTIHSVVHVKNMSTKRTASSIFEYMYGYQRESAPVQVGTGSGVIISEDGYIVTNNHVIEGASEIEITLNNNKSYKAKLIGTDKKMDIALLKIDEDEKMPYVVFADSDAVRVGEWALAVGNPYNLTSTVTAGIISAKARNLSKDGIQSFIQTDAAVNPGNSGGALVNTNGELIGINTMISSQTGSYVGYSFAVPSNITRKIIEDLMQFGNVQRGVLGISGSELNSITAQKLDIDLTQGVYVADVSEKSGAQKAGIKSGDIITKIDNETVNSFAELISYINSKRPGDKVNVLVLRDKKEKNFEVILTKKEILSFEFNGLEFEDLSDEVKESLGLDYGVKIEDVNNSNFEEYKDQLKGAVLLSVDRIKIKDVDALKEYLKNKNGQNSYYQIILKNKQLVNIIM